MCRFEITCRELFMNLKTMIYKLSNPLLFYTDKSGNSIFKNYNFFHEDGCLYNTKYLMTEAGKALEYRFDLSRYSLYARIVFSVLAYLIFINLRFTVFSFIFFVVLLVVIFSATHIACAKYYEKHLLKTFGSYKVVDFKPYMAPEKREEYKGYFKSKFIIALILFAVYLFPAIFMYGFLRLNVKSEKPHFKAIAVVSDTYLKLYPKLPIVYDIGAYAKYATEDYEGAIKNYKTIFKMTGKRFEQRDLSRFANILFLDKRLKGAQEAVDEFNEYSTKKKASIFEQSQLLWIKSMFSVKNDLVDVVEQDYDDLLASIPEDDFKNKFYISCDKAYMLYLLGKYEQAVKLYDELIQTALQKGGINRSDLNNLYAERGFAKAYTGDSKGAKEDFESSGYDQDVLQSHEPQEVGQGFVVDKF